MWEGWRRGDDAEAQSGSNKHPPAARDSLALALTLLLSGCSQRVQGFCHYCLLSDSDSTQVLPVCCYRVGRKKDKGGKYCLVRANEIMVPTFWGAGASACLNKAEARGSPGGYQLIQ